MCGNVILSVDVFELGDPAPSISSSPPHNDDDGDVHRPTVYVRPFGLNGPAMLSMSLDEADHFARQLWQVVADARNGKFVDDS
jgi:hypothetical protein